MKWFLGLIGFAAAAALGLWAYGAFGARKVMVAAPERREAVRAVYATGAVKAEQIAHIRPEVGGQVMQLPVKEGEEIREGMLVIQIAEKEQNAAVAEQASRVREASVGVEEAQQNYDRETQLLAQGATTQQAVDNAKATLDRASALLATVRATLATRRTLSGRGKVVSPISGVVTKVAVHAGDIIPPNMEAVTILDPTSFKIYASIDELDITRIRPGQEAVVAFDAMPRMRFKARVERIVPQADDVTKALPVILNLMDMVPNLSDGLTATVNIVQERTPNALTIPVTALLNHKGTNDTLFVVTDNNRLQRRAVKVGVRGEDYVEIVDGLRDEERVVLSPDPSWSSGTTVEIDRERAHGRR
ncbi:MAG: efflux RND transporter periplasmic adaptor subunit [Bacteroidetes bacterium]|nr:efflux RND transporter periplasmic adaptor subunit [Bacteroidota bacterium]